MPFCNYFVSENQLTSINKIMIGVFHIVRVERQKENILPNDSIWKLEVMV